MFDSTSAMVTSWSCHARAKSSPWPVDEISWATSRTTRTIWASQVTTTGRPGRAGRPDSGTASSYRPVTPRIRSIRARTRPRMPSDHGVGEPSRLR